MYDDNRFGCVQGFGPASYQLLRFRWGFGFGFSGLGLGFRVNCFGLGD